MFLYTFVLLLSGSYVVVHGMDNSLQSLYDKQNNLNISKRTDYIGHCSATIPNSDDDKKSSYHRILERKRVNTIKHCTHTPIGSEKESLEDNKHNEYNRNVNNNINEKIIDSFLSPSGSNSNFNTGLYLCLVAIAIVVAGIVARHFYKKHKIKTTDDTTPRKHALVTYKLSPQHVLT